MTSCTPISRRLFLGTMTAVALTPWRAVKAAGKPRIQVFKTPACGCCNMWVEHLESSGFQVQAEDLPDLSQIKRMAALPDHLISCHTGMVEGYVVEGHIPAKAIEKLLAERPKIRGLAVPGMPAGSPGMPSPDPERYDVIAFGEAEDRVFMSFIETDPA